MCQCHFTCCKALAALQVSLSYQLGGLKRQRSSSLAGKGGAVLEGAGVRVRGGCTQHCPLCVYVLGFML